jgi:hypothetical protein
LSRHWITPEDPVRRLACSVLILAATACTASPREQARTAAAEAASAQKLEQRLAGYQAEKPIDCLPALESSRANTEAIGSALLYKVNNGLIYRNDTTGGCENVGRGDFIVTRSPEGRLCRGDIGQTFQQGTRIPTGSCALGNFIPYRKPR